MNRAQVEGMMLALPLVALLAACSSPPGKNAGREPVAAPTARSAAPSAPPAPAAPAPTKPALRGRVALPAGATMSVEASADRGGALSFDLRDGELVEVLRSEMRSDGGVETSYCEVKSSAGQGWIPEAMLQDIGWSTGDGQDAPPQEAPRVVAREPLRIDVQQEEVQAPPSAVAPTSAVPDVLSVSPAGSGKPFDSRSLIVKGQYTIIDFFSEHCGPCRRLAPQLAALATTHPRIVLRKVDVDRPGANGIDWGSPIVQQYGISSLPYVELYDTDGTLLGTGQVALARLDELSRQR